MQSMKLGLEESACLILERGNYPQRRTVRQFLNCLGDVTMPKRAVLKDKLEQAKMPTAAPRVPQDKQAQRNGGRGRLIGAHISDAAYKEIRLMAAKLDMKHNELLRAAINEFLKANGGNPLA